MADYWYAYIGTGDPTSANNYRKMTAKPGCINGVTVCSILVPGSGSSTPDSPLSPAIQQYVINALGTLLAQPQDSGTAKKFVYLKPRG